jgi:hypothetical protein
MQVTKPSHGAAFGENASLVSVSKSLNVRYAQNSPIPASIVPMIAHMSSSVTVAKVLVPAATQQEM